MEATAIENKVRQRAYELYLKRGGTPGNDQDDWLLAEKQILEQTKTDQKEGVKKQKISAYLIK